MNIFFRFLKEIKSIYVRMFSQTNFFLPPLNQKFWHVLQAPFFKFENTKIFSDGNMVITSWIIDIEKK